MFSVTGYIFSICHVVLLVQDWFLDFSLLRLIQVVYAVYILMGMVNVLNYLRVVSVNPRSGYKKSPSLQIMVLMLDGISEHVAHA